MINSYTTEDVEKLREIANAAYTVNTAHSFALRRRDLRRMPDAYTRDYNPETKTTAESDPTAFLRRYVLDMPGSNSSYNGSDLDVYDIYGFIFYCSLENVPLCLGNEDLKMYVEWRLEIGK